MKKFQFSRAKFENGLLLAVGVGLALLLRFALRAYLSEDSEKYFLVWFDFIRDHGGFAALRYDFSNYNLPYLYLLTGGVYFNSWLAIGRIATIKLISILFDLLSAFWIAKIVALKFPGRGVGIYAGLLLLFLPTVFMNSALWGQAEAIYTSFLLAALYFLLRQRDAWAMIAFGLAVSFKLQAIFLAPLLVALVLLRKLSWRSVFWVPVVYAATLLPAWIAGRPLPDLLTIYLRQGGAHMGLTMNAPTLFAFFDNSAYELLVPAGMFFAAGMLWLGIAAIYQLRPKWDGELMVYLAVCTVLLTPFVLPKMHERYFYPAEVFSLILAFYRPRTFWLPIVLQVLAMFTYHTYFFNTQWIPLPILACAMLAVIAYLFYDLAKLMRSNAAKNEPLSAQDAIS